MNFQSNPDGRVPSTQSSAQSIQTVPMEFWDGSRQEFHENSDGINPLQLFWFVIKYRWLILSLLLAGVVAGVMFTWLQTPMYRSTAKMEILTSSAKVLQDIEVTSETADLRAFETAKQKVLSRDLAQRVVFELNLSDRDDFIAPTPKFSILNLIRRTTGSTGVAALEELTAEEREQRAILLVQENLGAQLIRNTSILSISFSHPIADYTARVTNQVARSFMDQTVDTKSETSDLARQFIQEQVVETKKDLEKAEKALVEYAEKAGLTVTGENASLISANLTEINKAISEAVNERLLAERYVEQVARDGAASLPQVFESESIKAAKEKITDLKALYEQRRATLKPGFPEMRRIRAQISELQRNMNIEISAIAKSVSIELEQAKAKDAALRQELLRLQAEETAFQRKNIRYTILKREADSNRAQYESLIKKLSEVGVGAELKNAGASLVDEGQVPLTPFSPRLGLNVVASLAVFAAFAAALIYLLEMLNNTFSIPDQIDSELKIPTLGIIPKLSEREFDSESSNPASAFAEAYRTLRTSVQFTGTEGGIKHLVITSSEPGEGKTTTASRLAADFAALGRRVVIVDADLRRPRLHRLYGVDNAIGLSNLLSNVVRSGDVKSLFKQTKIPNLWVMTAGTIPPNAADLLASPRMGTLLHQLSNHYDMIILDSAPVIGLSDAPILSRMADATLMVVAARQTTRKSAKGAISRLRSAGGNIVGAAFTKFEASQLDYNSSYSYMQSNYYAYGDQSSLLASDTLSKESASIAADQNNHALVNWLSGLRRRFS